MISQIYMYLALDWPVVSLLSHPSYIPIETETQYSPVAISIHGAPGNSTSFDHFSFFSQFWQATL